MTEMNMLPVGTVLRNGTYRIEKQLSSGGFGNTYVVRHLNFDEIYAMKEFFMKGLNTRSDETVTVSVPDNKSTFESQLAKFKKEAQRLRILDNKHIVKVHDLFEENGTAYYVMDFISGQSLAEKMKETSEPFKESKALDIFLQMLDALLVVHNNKPQILHLDIKPANIMLDNSGNAFLLDFGSSKQVDVDKGLTMSSGITLTKGYAPTELIDGNKDLIGPWTDLYELGASLYKILTNNQPPSVSEISEEGVKAFVFPDSISDKTRELVIWLMARSRSKRPKSVKEVIDFVKSSNNSIIDSISEDDEETIISSSSQIDSIGADNAFSENRQSKRWYVWVGIVLTAIVILGAGYVFFNNSQSDNNIHPVSDASVIEEEFGSSPKYVENKYFDNSVLGGYLYTGNLDNEGLPAGIGTAVFVKLGKPDGRSYRGTFVSGNLSSNRDAVFKFENGDEYVGTFQDNRFLKGKLSIASTGNYFVGTYYDNIPSEGIWYDKNGKVLKKRR